MTARTLGEISNRLAQYQAMQDAFEDSEVEDAETLAVQVAKSAYLRKELKEDLLALYTRPKGPVAERLVRLIVEVL